MISTIKAYKLLKKGYMGYSGYVIEVKEEVVKIEDVLVVCEFLDAFPEELPGLPLNKGLILKSSWY